MSDAPGQSPRNPPQPHVGRRRLPLVWMVPVLALGFAGWLAYNNWPQGTTISICLNSGAGLDPGKSRILHRDIQVGLVQRVTLAPDLSHAVVTARMQPEIVPYLDGAHHPSFRVVRPQFSLQGFSGLDTLVTGASIVMDIDQSAAAKKQEDSGIEKDAACMFDARQTTLRIKSSDKSKQIALQTESVSPAKPGSPVLFRGIKIGEVIGYNQGYSQIKDKVTINIAISALYAGLVTNQSRFYRARSIIIETTPAGFKPEFESIDAFLSGGVILDNPESAGQAADASAPAGADPDDIKLYGDVDAARNSRFAGSASLVKLASYFTEPVTGLVANAPVMFHGLRIGTVVEVRLERDPLRQEVIFQLEPDRLAIAVSPPPGREWGGAVNRQIINDIVQPGLHAQVKTTGFVLGQTVIDLDFYSVPAAGKLNQVGDYLEIPVAASSSTNKLLDDADKVLIAAKDFMGGQSTTDTLQNLARLTAMLPRLLTRSEAVLADFDKTLGSANDLIGGDSRMRRDVWDLMSQTRDMLRSIKGLADYLEAHPETLVRGKGTDQRQ